MNNNREIKKKKKYMNEVKVRLTYSPLFGSGVINNSVNK